MRTETVYVVWFRMDVPVGADAIIRVLFVGRSRVDHQLIVVVVVVGLPRLYIACPSRSCRSVYTRRIGTTYAGRDIRRPRRRNGNDRPTHAAKPPCPRPIIIIAKCHKYVARIGHSVLPAPSPGSIRSCRLSFSVVFCFGATDTGSAVLRSEAPVR